jgi:hypothetical protein
LGKRNSGFYDSGKRKRRETGSQKKVRDVAFEVSLRTSYSTCQGIIFIVM